MRYHLSLIPLLLSGCACLAPASEVLDPPQIDGWRYSHRLYHGVAGAVIGFAAGEIERAIAPAWCRRHPVLASLIAEAPVVGAAVGKEVLDRRFGSETLHHSAMDVAVTSLGGVVGVAVSIRF